MAYVREEKETFEIDYPLEKVWAAIPIAVKALQWSIKEKNDANHKATLKTKGGFLSYSTQIVVEATSKEETTHLKLSGETPVTTITSMLDFGRTQDRIEQLIGVLAGVLKKEKDKEKKKKPM
jgi:carbon monoxide dehydrogenase subunit G